MGLDHPDGRVGRELEERHPGPALEERARDVHRQAANRRRDEPGGMELQNRLRHDPGHSTPHGTRTPRNSAPATATHGGMSGQLSSAIVRSVVKARVFRDPVHGLIELAGDDARLGDVLDTRAVQRLRRIRQDGFASLVYPGAEHSRFGHALGAFHVAGRVTRHLEVAPEVARDVKLAALLHDLGHGPFSHAWEVALGGLSHEAWGGRIVAEDDELAGVLTAIEPSLPARLASFPAGTYRPRFARKLVSSQLDVDRMDYLLRDAHYTGVGYSAYDLDWIIYALGVAPVGSGDDPQDLVIDFGRGANALEQFLFGRFYMYAQVYYHKTVRAAEILFGKLMERFALLGRDGREPPGLAIAGKLARGENVSVAEYLALDDARVAVAMEDWADRAEDEVLRDLARRLCRRRLFKTLELPAAAAEVFGDRAAWYWSLDRTEQLGYDAQPGDELFVVGHPRHGIVDLGELWRELPIGREVSTLRVVCAPELLSAFRALVHERR
jgi:hypothetical protein